MWFAILNLQLSTENHHNDDEWKENFIVTIVTSRRTLNQVRSSMGSLWKGILRPLPLTGFKNCSVNTWRAPGVRSSVATATVVGKPDEKSVQSPKTAPLKWVSVESCSRRSEESVRVRPAENQTSDWIRIGRQVSFAAGVESRWVYMRAYLCPSALASSALCARTQRACSDAACVHPPRRKRPRTHTLHGEMNNLSLITTPVLSRDIIASGAKSKK